MKKGLKKAISVLLIAVMVCGAAPLSGLAGLEFSEFGGIKKLVVSVSDFFEDFGIKAEATEYTSGYYTYTVNYDNTAVITDVDTSISGNVTIPSTIEGYTVARIGTSAFSGCSNIISITFPEDLKSIGGNSFQNCSNLTTVYYNATKINYYGFDSKQPFRNCPSLTTIYIGDNVISIPSGIFYGCSGLENVVIGKSVEEIGSGSFRECGQISEIIIPESVVTIGDSAFYKCKNLAGIEFPSSLNEIGSQAFSYCTGLSNITIPGNVKIIGSSAFSNCTGLTDITVMDGVTHIYDGAFSGCTNANNIRIPKNLRDLGNSALYNTPFYNNEENWENGVLYFDNYLIKAHPRKISTDYKVKEGTTLIAANAFWESIKLTSVTLPDSVITIGRNAFKDCEELSVVILSKNTKHIDDGAFCHCYKITEISLPNTLEYIGYQAFKSCCFVDIVIPDSVKYIGKEAFYYCPYLSSVTIGKNVTYIGQLAFNGCSNMTTLNYNAIAVEYNENNSWNTTSLTTVNIGDSVEIIPGFAFFDCANLKSVELPDSVKVIGQWAFKNCSNLERIDVNNGLSVISDSAFENCSALKNVQLPDSVTDIGFNAFYSCTNLIRINFPAELISIGTQAFAYCVNLKQAILGEKVTSIGEGAFRDCTSLVCFNVPDSVELLDRKAFYNCINLLKVTIGENTKALGNQAFANCAKLKTFSYNAVNCVFDSRIFENCNSFENLHIGNKVESIPSEAFKNCNEIKGSLIIPDSVKEIDRYAFWGCTGITDVTIGKGLTEIRYGVFYNCTNLSTVNFNAENCLRAYYESGYSIFGYSGVKTINIGENVGCLPGGIFNGVNFDNTINVNYYAENLAQDYDGQSFGNLSYLFISKTVKKIPDRLFYPNSIGVISYEGNEEEWNEIIINSTSGNQHNLKEATVFFKTALKKERKIIVGTLTQFDGIGNPPMAYINGVGYKVSGKDSLWNSLQDNLFKEVVCIAEDNVIVSCYANEDIDVNLSSSVSVTPTQIIYKDGEYFTTEVKVRLTVSNNVLSSFEGDVSDLEKMSQYDAVVSSVSINSTNVDLLNFNSKAIAEFEEFEPKTLHAGESYYVEGVFKVNTKHKIGEETASENVTISANADVSVNGESKKLSGSKVVTFVNKDYISKADEWLSDKEKEIQKAAEKAAGKFADLKKKNGYKNAVTLDANLSLVFSEAELDYIEDYILMQIMLQSISDESVADKVLDNLKDAANDGVLDELDPDLADALEVFFGSYEFDVNVYEKTVEVEMVIETKDHGTITLTVSCDITKTDLNDSEIASFGNLSYRISGKKLPKGMFKTGVGSVTTVDIEKFCEAAEELVVEEISALYSSVWGDDLDTVTDIVCGETVNDILACTDYGSAQGVVFAAMIAPAKKVTAKCPVDVFVYDSVGELCASVENNIVTKSCDKASISVEGSEKSVLLFDESYHIIFKPTGSNATMDITIDEYANSDGHLRTVCLNDVPLEFGEHYLQIIDTLYLDDENYYSLVSLSTGEEIKPDSVDKGLHYHNLINCEVVQAATPSTPGKIKGECTVCYETITQLMNYSNNESDSPDNPDSPSNNNGFIVVREPSTTTISYGDCIILHADLIETLPSGWYIEWTASNGNFAMEVSTDGTTCKISPNSSGDTTFTATVYDENNNVISSDEQTMTSKAGFFDKIIAFFKKLFGLTKTIPQIYNGIF